MSYRPVIGLFNMGGWEWLVVALVALILFGNRLPQVARSLARSLVQFKKGLSDAEEEIRQAGNPQDGDSPYVKPSEKQTDADDQKPDDTAQS